MIDRIVHRADVIAGRYRRQGNHDSQGVKTDEAGYELETGVLLWNRPGERELFPSLITSLSFHRPGELVGHGAKLVESHERLGFKDALIISDRAYNGEKAENFHIPDPTRRLGARHRLQEVGPRTAEHLYLRSTFILQSTCITTSFLVGGNWYVTWMPQDLIDATKN
jgi:hypothetical protein